MEIIRTNGAREAYLPANGRHYTLKELQNAVGGLIEIVYTKDGRPLVINEEGKLRNLPINTEATHLYRFGDHDSIVGDALLCNGHEIKKG